MTERKELLDWFWKKEKKFTLDEVKDLVDRICAFDCGAIDLYLTRHAKHTLEEWTKEKQQ